jgi:hypothetical protein
MEDVLHAMAEPVFNSSLNRGGLNTGATMQNSKIATVISAKLLSIREGVMAPTSPPVSALTTRVERVLSILQGS